MTHLLPSLLPSLFTLTLSPPEKGGSFFTTTGKIYWGWVFVEGRFSVWPFRGKGGTQVSPISPERSWVALLCQAACFLLLITQVMTVSVNRSWAQLKRPPQKVVRTAQSVFRASVAGKSYLVAVTIDLTLNLTSGQMGCPAMCSEVLECRCGRGERRR